MIEVRGLVKLHGRVTVLDGVSLAIRKGEVAAVIGPSGGGKSTLLRCINGLETFSAGEVQVGEHVLTPATHPRRDARRLQAVRRTAGFVFQQFNLFPHLTALENVTEAPVHVLGRPRAEAEARARELLRQVGLEERAQALPRQLSGGQQQRVAIARALAMEPQALLLDEPTSALDPVMAESVLQVISDLAARQQTMVIVTHQIGFARRVAHTVHVLAGGKAVESGPPERVLREPRHEVTRSFLRTPTPPAEPAGAPAALGE